MLLTVPNPLIPFALAETLMIAVAVVGVLAVAGIAVTVVLVLRSRHRD
jgi:Tfp pilus assembly protein PilE